MTEPLTQAIPTPGDLARRPPRAVCAAPTLTGMPCPAPADGITPPAPPAAAMVAAARPPYDRHAWEEALIATKLPHQSARLLGWGLAHLAGEAGYLPPGMPNAEHLARTLRMSGKQVRMSLAQLEVAHLIARPDLRTWTPREIVRPLTLTLPPAAAQRTEPPHTGGAGE